MLISNQLKRCKETQAKKAINEKVTEKLSFFFLGSVPLTYGSMMPKNIGYGSYGSGFGSGSGTLV